MLTDYSKTCAMIFFRITILLLFCLPLFGQESIDVLKKQLEDAKSNQEKLSINYQLAESYLRSSEKDNEKMALKYAKDALDLAKALKNDGMSARTSYLIGNIYENLGDDKNQEVWYRSSEGLARNGGDLDLIVKSVIKRGRLANAERNYRRAAQIYEDAFNYFSSKGTSISELEAKFEAEKMQLEKAKKQLEAERQQLQDEITSLRSESEQLNLEKSQLQANQEQLIQAKAKVEKEITVKEKELETVSEAKEEAERLAQQKEEEVKLLSRDTLEQRYLRQVAENDARKTREITYISLGMVAILVLLSLFLYARFVLKRRASRILAQEKKRSDDLLLNILPKEIANELKASGGAKARKYENVSVLFSDFKNFTNISEKLSPEELVKELDYCFKGFDEIISEYDDIEKIKTIGDAYMCASGLRNEPEKSKPHNLIRAAIRMQQFLGLRKETRQTENKEYFEARMGIHTGPVVAGVVGKNKFAYDIWGDTVNTASRIENTANINEVNISESTYDLVKDDFDCEALGKIEAKNKGFLSIFRVRRAP